MGYRDTLFLHLITKTFREILRFGPPYVIIFLTHVILISFPSINICNCFYIFNAAHLSNSTLTLFHAFWNLFHVFHMFCIFIYSGIVTKCVLSSEYIVSPILVSFTHKCRFQTVWNVGKSNYSKKNPTNRAVWFMKLGVLNGCLCVLSNKRSLSLIHVYFSFQYLESSKTEYVDLSEAALELQRQYRQVHQHNQKYKRCIPFGKVYTEKCKRSRCKRSQKPLIPSVLESECDSASSTPNSLWSGSLPTNEHWRLHPFVYFLRNNLVSLLSLEHLWNITELTF